MKNPAILNFSPAKLSLTLALALTLTSCSWFSSSDDKAKKEAEDARPAEEIYDGAKADLEKGSLQKSIKGFQEVERLYPFSPLANKAKVNAAVAQYYDQEYDKAIDIVEEFVSMNPGNEEIEFMYYLKAICYYDRIQDVKRDQEITKKAQAAFDEVINRFPKSKYARDSQYKLDLIKDHLAAKEMEVGRFYVKQKNYLAGINRFKEVVKNFDDTEQIEEALYRLTESSLILGLDDEAKRYATILGYNYSSSVWYKRAYDLMSGAKESGDSKTFVGRVMDTFSFSSGSSADSAQPADLKSSPNLVDTGGWITDDSAIKENEGEKATPAETPAEAPAPAEATPAAETGEEQQKPAE